MKSRRESPMTSSQNLIPSRSLHGHRLLVVQSGPPVALAVGASLARAGADIWATRDPRAALHELSYRKRGFDAALLDCKLSASDAVELIGALRDGPNPCLAVGLGYKEQPRGARRLVRAGVIELVVPPLSAELIQEAMVRCTLATAHLRSRLDAAMSMSRCDGAPRRGPQHWGALQGGGATAKAIEKGDIDGAVDVFSTKAGLSPRECCVLRLIALGYRYQEIGSTLDISPRTVKMHAANLRRKAGVSDRYELLRKMFST